MPWTYGWGFKVHAALLVMGCMYPLYMHGVMSGSIAHACHAVLLLPASCFQILLQNLMHTRKAHLCMLRLCAWAVL